METKVWELGVEREKKKVELVRYQAFSLKGVESVYMAQFSRSIPVGTLNSNKFGSFLCSIPNFPECTFKIYRFLLEMCSLVNIRKSRVMGSKGHTVAFSSVSGIGRL